MRKIITVIAAIILAVSVYALSAYPQPTYSTFPPAAVLDATERALITGAETPGGAAGTRLFIVFSHTAGFYTEDIELSILCSVPDALIYYTTDGSEPTTESNLYGGEPLELTAFRTLNVRTIRAIAIHEGVQTSELAATYFMGQDVEKRFSTYVFSLSTNEEYLYDYDTGIFVPGRLRDEYIAENPGVHIEPPAPANFNIRGMAGERPVYMEVFTQDGERVIAQMAGLRVQGGWSRANDQKSLRLIARSRYETGAGKFRYPFFEGETVEDGYGTPLVEFDSLVLRNGANDRDFAMIRNEVASRLARDAGFRLVSPEAAAAVFLNGEYYGFAWLQVTINAQYLQDVYGAPSQEFQIVGDGDTWYNTEDIEAKEALIEMNSYAEKDLSDDAVFAELEKILDVDNFLLYFAIETYLDNNDWPNNNMKRWRYIGGLPEDGRAYPEELDGRWRYIMYDLDWTLGLYDFSYMVDSFRRVSRLSPLFTALLERPQTRDKFAQYIMALGSTVITEDAVSALIDELYGAASREIDHAFAARKFSFWVTHDTVANNHDNMRFYARMRHDRLARYLQQRHDYGEVFEVNVTGGIADFGAGRGDKAQFVSGHDVSLKAVVPKHHVFEKWVINERKDLYEQEITINSDMAQRGDADEPGVVSLELVIHEQLPEIVFESAFSSANSSGCTLRNTTDSEVNTAGYYISDTQDNPFRFALPAAAIPPGGTLSFAGRGSSTIDDIHKIQLDFRVQNGEVLFLSDEAGEIVDWMVVGEGQ